MDDIQRKYEDRRREKKIDGETVDRSAYSSVGWESSGAIDKDVPEDYDYGGAETTFYDRDSNSSITRSDGSELSYGRLWYLQHGHSPSVTDDDSEQQRREQFRERQLLTVCNQLGVGENQEEEAIELLQEVDLDQFGSLKEEAAILAIITFVCNRNDWWVQRSSIFRELRKGMDVSEDHLRQSRQKLREQFDD